MKNCFVYWFKDHSHNTMLSHLTAGKICCLHLAVFAFHDNAYMSCWQKCEFAFLVGKRYFCFCFSHESTHRFTTVTTYFFFLHKLKIVRVALFCAGKDMLVTIISLTYWHTRRSYDQCQDWFCFQPQSTWYPFLQFFLKKLSHFWWGSNFRSSLCKTSVRTTLHSVT